MSDRRDRQMDELVSLLIRLIIRPRPGKLDLPENLARAERRLLERRPGTHAMDDVLFYRVGSVLFGGTRPLAMGEISEALGVSLSTATRTVDWLVESAYARRLADPDDRRVVRVALTASGRRLFREIDAWVRSKGRELLERFTVAERAVLIGHLGKLVAGLDEMGL